MNCVSATAETRRPAVWIPVTTKSGRVIPVKKLNAAKVAATSPRADQIIPRKAIDHGWITGTPGKANGSRYEGPSQLENLQTRPTRYRSKPTAAMRGAWGP